MKKQIVFLITSLAVVLIGAAFYMGVLQKKAKESLLERIPASKPHSHVSPVGDVVEHTHTSIRPPTGQPKNTDSDPATAKHSMLRIWENLDLAVIKRDYQPYTVQEMIEKWDEKHSAWAYPSRSNARQAQLAQSEAYWPKEEWLQHLMDHGFPFSEYAHYCMAFQSRGRLALIYQKKYDNPEIRADFLEDFDLPADATWEDFEELSIKFDIVARIKNQRARDVDPSVFGGVTGIDGVFTPFTPNTVYVHVSEDKSLSTFKGAMLSEQQKNDLTMFGVAPKGVTVVYTDEKGVPLPADAVPRFYERKMAALEAAEAHVEQLIADHDALFKTMPAQPQKNVSTEQSTSAQQSQQSPQGKIHPHQKDDSASEENNRRPTLHIDGRNIPREMLPPDPPSRENMKEWFEVLQVLHGGELPKDLRVLQEVVTELNAIRQAEADRK